MKKEGKIYNRAQAEAFMQLQPTERLKRELWRILNDDNGKAIEAMLKMKQKDARRGRAKRLVGEAIRKSTLGMFSGMRYFFGGKVYEKIDRRAFYSVIYDIMANEMVLPDSDLIRLSDIYADCDNIVWSKPLKFRTDIMVFQNGVLDIEKKMFHEYFCSDYVQMWIAEYEYERNARTFMWYQFIRQVLPDDEFRDALQMFLGATFLDRSKVKIEHIVILLGKGSNGKSVIQQTVCGVLGSEYVSQMEIGRLCNPSKEGDLAIAEINGKRLNYCTEMDESDFHRKTARMKALVSGEPVTARQQYGNPFKACNIPLLMANTNRLPVFNHKDEAMMRRIFVIPFTVTIPEERQNKSLCDDLRYEYSAILNWILEGRDKFIENGYRLPNCAAVEEFVAAEATEYSTVLSFMKKKGYEPRVSGVQIEPCVWVNAKTMHGEYVRWCQNNGFEDPVTKTVFVHLLRDAGYRYERKTHGNSFAVWGTHLDKLRAQKAAQKQAEMQRKQNGFIYIDGKQYATSLKQLAEYCGVSYTIIRERKMAGIFDGCMRAQGRNDVYDIKECYERLVKQKDIITDTEKSLLSKLRKDAKYKRDLFNIRQKKRGWPYRMFDNDKPQIDEGLVVVPDWTTDEEVIAMAKRDGFDTRNIVGAKGAYSSGGKGTFKSQDEIPDIVKVEKILHGEVVTEGQDKKEPKPKSVKIKIK